MEINWDQSGQNNFEMSETLATFLASTPLLEEAWRVCNIANISFPGAYLVERIGSVAYIAFSGRQMTSGSDEKCRNLVALSKEDGGVFAPLYRHSEAEEPMVHHGMLKLFFSMFPSLQIQVSFPFATVTVYRFNSFLFPLFMLEDLIHFTQSDLKLKKIIEF